MIKTASDIHIEWEWIDPPPVHLFGFRQALKRAWRKEFGDACIRCNNKMMWEQKHRSHGRYATIDHIKARGLGGDDSLKNIRIICSVCNNRKSRHEASIADKRRISHRWKKK